MGQLCVLACVARILNALIMVTGGEKDEPQIQMGRILSECRIELMEHGRGLQGSGMHRGGMLPGIYTAMMKDTVQVHVMYSILQK